MRFVTGMLCLANWRAFEPNTGGTWANHKCRGRDQKGTLADQVGT